VNQEIERAQHTKQKSKKQKAKRKEKIIKNNEGKEDPQNGSTRSEERERKKFKIFFSILDLTCHGEGHVF
jgi:hypothetical protein